MSERLIQQLKRVTRVEIPEPPKNFKMVSIPRQIDLSSAALKAGDQLLIEVPDYIVHPSQNFDLHKKWNNNQPPTDYIMQAVVIETLGKMVHVNTMSYSIEDQRSTGRSWIGWLPRASIKIRTKYGE